MKKLSDMSFSELFDIAYFHYLKTRKSYNIELTKDQKDWIQSETAIKAERYVKRS